MNNYYLNYFFFKAELTKTKIVILNNNKKKSYKTQIKRLIQHDPTANNSILNCIEKTLTDLIAFEFSVCLLTNNYNKFKVSLS